MDDKLIAEYEQCFDNWRFFVGLRFTLLAFFLTLTSVLLYGAFSLPIFHERLYQILISLIGLISSWSIFTIEGRNRQLYYQCLKRAMVIEKQFKSMSNESKEKQDNCLAHCIEFTAPKTFRAWHTGGIFALYSIAILIWFSLLIAALLSKFPIN